MDGYNERIVKLLNRSEYVCAYDIKAPGKNSYANFILSCNAYKIFSMKVIDAGNACILQNTLAWFM